MTLLHSCFFLWPGPRGNAPWPIKAVAVARIMGYRTVDICIMNKSSVYINYSGVILESSSIPSSSAKTITAITITIINTAIEAYASSPVTIVKAVKAAAITPIAGCP